MNNNKMLATSLIGTVIAALCCFTPLLVMALGAVGLSAILGYLDYILLPALGLFILMTIFALYRRQS